MDSIAVPIRPPGKLSHPRPANPQDPEEGGVWNCAAAVLVTAVGPLCFSELARRPLSMAQIPKTTTTAAAVDITSIQISPTRVAPRAFVTPMLPPVVRLSIGVAMRFSFILRTPASRYPFRRDRCRRSYRPASGTIGGEETRGAVAMIAATSRPPVSIRMWTCRQLCAANADGCCQSTGHCQSK